MSSWTLYGAPQIEGIALYAKIQDPKAAAGVAPVRFAAGIDLSFIGFELYHHQH